MQRQDSAADGNADIEEAGDDSGYEIDSDSEATGTSGQASGTTVTKESSQLQASTGKVLSKELAELENISVADSDEGEAEKTIWLDEQ